MGLIQIRLMTHVIRRWSGEHGNDLGNPAQGKRLIEGKNP
jgi:hypothetical protein